jgi:hypothetical protein
MADPNKLVIVDECSGVDDSVFDAIAAPGRKVVRVFAPARRGLGPLGIAAADLMGGHYDASLAELLYSDYRKRHGPKARG